MYKHKKMFFIKSRSNSSNKAEKQMFEAKTVINYSSLKTSCDLCLQRLSYKSTEKVLKKTKLKNPNFIFFIELVINVTEGQGNKINSKNMQLC